jgi:hypothetical protein
VHSLPFEPHEIDFVSAVLVVILFIPAPVPISPLFSPSFVSSGNSVGDEVGLELCEPSEDFRVGKGAAVVELGALDRISVGTPLGSELGATLEHGKLDVTKTGHS